MGKSFAAGLLLAGLVAGLASGDTTDIKTNKDTNQLKKDYQVKIHKDLKKVSAKIDQLKRSVEKGGQAAGTDFDHQVKKLEAQKAGVDRKLVELERSTGDAWQDLRHGVDGALADLKKSVDEASRQFAKK